MRCLSCRASVDSRAVCVSSDSVLWNWFHRKPLLELSHQLNCKNVHNLTFLVWQMMPIIYATYRNSKNAKFLSKFIWQASTGLPAACANPDRCICWLKYSIISSSVTPNGMLPTYSLSNEWIKKNDFEQFCFSLDSFKKISIITAGPGVLWSNQQPELRLAGYRQQCWLEFVLPLAWLCIAMA